MTRPLPPYSKSSELREGTRLKPHQERVIRRIQSEDQPGLVVAHGLGSGKTLTAIAAADLLGGRASFYVPASLQENIAKELSKHLERRNAKFQVGSLQRAARGQLLPKADTMVVDEAHRASNPETSTHAALAQAGQGAGKRLLLTATPIYNHPADLTNLINLAAGERVLPGSRSGFEASFVDTEMVAPPLLQRILHGGDAVKVKRLRDTPELREGLGKWVDYHTNDGSDGFPDRIDERVEVPMTAKQHEVYAGIIGQSPALAYKIRKGLPASRQESKMLNAFSTAARQVANTPHTYVKGADINAALEEAPKIQEALRRFKERAAENPNHRAVVYSNFLESGLNLYADALEKEGIPFGMFRGGLTSPERKELVDRYNSGELKALLISSAGAEGLDLKGTRQMQLLDPHWNEPKMDQIAGRGIRYLSHDHLPEDQRNVTVERYEAITPRATGLRALLGGEGGEMTIDGYVRQSAQSKQALADQVVKILREETQRRAEGMKTSAPWSYFAQAQRGNRAFQSALRKEHHGERLQDAMNRLRGEYPHMWEAARSADEYVARRSGNSIRLADYGIHRANKGAYMQGMPRLVKAKDGRSYLAPHIGLDTDSPQTLVHELGHAYDDARTRQRTGQGPTRGNLQKILDQEVFANRFTVDVLGAAKGFPTLGGQTTYNHVDLMDSGLFGASTGVLPGGRKYRGTYADLVKATGARRDPEMALSNYDSERWQRFFQNKVRPSSRASRLYEDLLGQHHDVLRRQGFGDSADLYAQDALNYLKTGKTQPVWRGTNVRTTGAEVAARDRGLPALESRPGKETAPQNLYPTAPWRRPDPKPPSDPGVKTSAPQGHDAHAAPPRPVGEHLEGIMDKGSSTSHFLRYNAAPDPKFIKAVNRLQGPNRTPLSSLWALTQAEYPQFARGAGDVIRALGKGQPQTPSPRMLSVRGSETPSWRPAIDPRLGGQVSIHAPIESALAHEVGHGVDSFKGYPSQKSPRWSPLVSSEVYANSWAQDVLGARRTVPNMFAQSTYNHKHMLNTSRPYGKMFENYTKAVERAAPTGNLWDGDPESWYRQVENVSPGHNPFVNPMLANDSRVRMSVLNLGDVHANALRKQGFTEGADLYRTELGTSLDKTSAPWNFYAQRVATNPRFVQRLQEFQAPLAGRIPGEGVPTRERLQDAMNRLRDEYPHMWEAARSADQYAARRSGNAVRLADYGVEVADANGYFYRPQFRPVQGPRGVYGAPSIGLSGDSPQALVHELGHAYDYRVSLPGKSGFSQDPILDGELAANHFGVNVLGPQRAIPLMGAQSSYNHQSMFRRSPIGGALRPSVLPQADAYRRDLESYYGALSRAEAQMSGRRSPVRPRDMAGTAYEGGSAPWANPLTWQTLMTPQVKEGYERLLNHHHDVLKSQGFGQAADAYTEDAFNYLKTGKSSPVWTGANNRITSAEDAARDRAFPFQPYPAETEVTPSSIRQAYGAGMDDAGAWKQVNPTGTAKRSSAEDVPEPELLNPTEATRVTLAPALMDHAMRQAALQTTQGLHGTTLDQVRTRSRAPSAMLHPLTAVSLMAAFDSMESARRSQDPIAFEAARESALQVAELSAMLDMLKAPKDLATGVKALPARLAGGQGLGAALKGTALSALARPMGAAGLLAILHAHAEPSSPSSM